MSILNENLDLADAPADVRRAFLRGQARNQPLAAGHELYKFTNSPLFDVKDGSVTCWWSSVKPLDPRDSGLDGIIARTENLGVAGSDLARAINAVDKGWNNTMSGFLRVRLLVPVYGLYGRCAHQFFDSKDNDLKNVFWIGGAWQLWIPGLSRHAHNVIKV